MAKGLLCSLLILSGCSGDDAGKPIAVSYLDPQAKALAFASATAQGIVGTNPAGEVVPALAESWIVTNDGMSYIFRLRRAQWPDGRKLSAVDAVRSLKAALAPDSQNRLRPAMRKVINIVAMTDRVLEIDLSAPQSNLLAILARPELGIVSRGRGLGPFVDVKSKASFQTLRPLVAPDQVDKVSEDELKKREVQIFDDNASNGVARYAQGLALAVNGGGYDNLPFVRASGISKSHLQIDPVSGLFGLVASSSSKALEHAPVRRALAMAIDRDSLLSAFAVQGWQLTNTIGPIGVSAPDWADLPIGARQDRARQLIRHKMSLKIQLPNGPGARILLANLRRDWAELGVGLERVGLGGNADLKLVDHVAPFPGADWYFGRLACGQGFQCSKSADLAAAKLGAATNEGDRQTAITAAYKALATDQVFIPIAMPLRWSLVHPNLQGVRPNVTGLHPLVWLRRGP